jgi:hypothetical protein
MGIFTIWRGSVRKLATNKCYSHYAHTTAAPIHPITARDPHSQRIAAGIRSHKAGVNSMAIYTICRGIVLYCAMGSIACAQAVPDFFNDTTAVRIPRIEDTPYAIPKSTEIATIVAETYDSPALLPDLPQFELPESYFTQIVERLTDSKLDPDPVLSFHEIGTMRIIAKDGSSRRICWYWQGKGSLKLSVQGVRYYSGFKTDVPRDQAIELDGILRKAYFERTGLDATIPRKVEIRKKQ